MKAVTCSAWAREVRTLEIGPRPPWLLHVASSRVVRTETRGTVLEIIWFAGVALHLLILSGVGATVDHR